MQSDHKTIFVFLFIGIFLLGSISALTFQQNTETNFRFTCINAGFCSSGTDCNISLFSPTQDLLISGRQATQSADLANFNITFNSSSLSEFGEYTLGGFCKDGSVTNIIDITFDVTADGNPFEAFPNQFAVIALAIILIMFGLFQERFRLLKHMGGIILMVMGVITLFPGYNFINHTTLFGVALGSILIAIGFYFLIEDSFSRGDQEDSYQQDDEFIEEDLNR